MSEAADAGWMVAALVILPLAVGLLIALLARVRRRPPPSENRDGSTRTGRRDD